MTTEAVLLLGLFAFLLLGAFMGPSGPRNVFNSSGPRLGARLEQHISTGQGFQVQGARVPTWERPETNEPAGTF